VASTAIVAVSTVASEPGGGDTATVTVTVLGT
jgi:hypothetical protein